MNIWIVKEIDGVDIGTGAGGTDWINPSTASVINKTADYTLVFADNGKVFTFDSVVDVILTVPTGLPVGYNISIYQIGVGKVNIQGGAAILNRLSRFKTAGKDVIVNMLPVLDDFDRAFKASDKVTDESAKEALKGFQLIYNKFKSTLDQKGLEVMDCDGKEFDPEYHEALTEIPAPTPDLQGKIIDVLEKGYYLNDKIIRYAKVVVGK